MSGPLNLEQILRFLLDTPMFGDLDSSELSRVVHLMQITHLRADQVLFREGAPGDAWYVVYDGTLAVRKDGRTLAALSARSCVGEMAVLDGSPRSATVSAHGDATVFRFSRDAFEALRLADDLVAYKLVYHMARTLAVRQRETTERLGAWLRQHPEEAASAAVALLVERATTAE